MPFKNREEYNEYMRRYRAKQRANWHTDMEEPKEEFPEQAYSETFERPRRIFEKFGEDKKGMVVICSVCGTPLDKNGSCPMCERGCD